MEKLKRAFCYILSTVLLTGIIQIAAVNGFAETYGDFTYSVEGSSAVITKYNNTTNTGSVNIPSKIGSYTVVTIDKVCFSEAKISSVSVPSTVTFIDDQAFVKCVNLSSVSIGSGLNRLGTNVFSGTTKLSSINVSSENKYFKDINGVLYNKSGTVIYAYPSAKKDTSFFVPDTVTYVEHYAFDGADNLTSLIVGAGFTDITELAFIGASNIKTISLTGKVTRIGENAFSNINALQSINLPDTLTYIGPKAFQDDSALESILIPKSVTYIGVDAFEACADNFLVYCYSGSYAVTYCESHNIEYELVDSMLQSISVASLPSKTRYCQGETLETSGLVITALYSSGITATVTGYTVSEFESETLGVKTVTVSFTDNNVTKTTSFEVTVGDHIWDEGTAVVPATCTDAGEYLYKCTICAAEKEETVEALGHNPADIVYDEPTCETSGVKDIVCSRCNEIIETDVVIPPLGHICEDGSYTEYKEATCTESGRKAGVCTRCGQSFDDIIAPLGHNYQETVINPGCDSCGAVITACTRCGDAKSAVITPAKGHDYTTSVKQATCTENGYTTHTCKNCGHTYISDYVKAKGHVYIVKSKAATCTDYGYTYKECTECGESGYTEFFNPKGHNFSSVKKAATSTDFGYTKHTCSACKLVYYTDLVKATGPSSVTISVSSTVQVGKTCKITASLKPNGIVDRVTYKSSNTAVATVSSTGVVTGKKAGTVTITATVSNGKKTTKKITVKTPTPTLGSLQSVAKKRLKINWSKVSYASGYVVQYCTRKDFKSGVVAYGAKKNTITSVTYRNLKSGKTYYVRVCAYRLINGKRSYSSWSSVKSIKIK